MHRIAMISAHTCPLATLGTGDAGGMNVYVAELSKSLSSRGFKIDVFTRHQDPSLPVMVKENGVRVVYLKAGPQSPYPKEFLPRYFGEFLDEIVSFADLESYRLVHSHHWLSGWVASKLKDIWEVPMIHTFHTLGRLKPSTQYRLRMETHTIREAESIIATSGAERNQLVESYNAQPHKIDVIPCGVNLRLFGRLDSNLAKRHLGLPDHNYLLFVGRMDPVKSIGTLLKSMGLLRSRAHLLVIGGEDGNSELEKAKRIASVLGIADRVTFLGAQPQTVLPYYYSAAEACVLPSRYESFGLVVLEAMACGTPVVASRVGGIPEVVDDGETGFLTTPGDEKEMADKIDWLMEHENLRNRMSLQARERAKEFGWDRVASRVASVYDGYAS